MSGGYSERVEGVSTTAHGSVRQPDPFKHKESKPDPGWGANDITWINAIGCWTCCE